MNTCCWRGCSRRGPHGIGWGFSTGLVQFYCAPHFGRALARLARLVEPIQGLAAR